MGKKFKLIAAAGTFDRLHQGHQFFLRKAFFLSQQVIVGVTSDEFIKKKFLGSEILPYEKRNKDVLEFLKENDLDKRAILLKLDDLYGPTLDKNLPVEGILVTEKTVFGGKIINTKRKSLGLPPLKLIKVGLLRQNGENISSRNFRKRLILKKNLVLPGKLRPLLKKPLGELYQGKKDDLKIAALAAKTIIEKNKPPLIITVGDVVTQSFNQAGIPISLAIVDFKVKREKIFKNLFELGFSKKAPDLIVKNPPGTISHFLSAGIKKMLAKVNQKPLVLRVLGEEDLAVLPTIIFSSKNSAIFYGQPEKGIVFIKIDKTIKNKIFRLLSRFSPS